MNEFFYGYAFGGMIVQWINVIVLGLLQTLLFTTVMLLVTLMVLYLDMNSAEIGTIEK